MLEGSVELRSDSHETVLGREGQWIIPVPHVRRDQIFSRHSEFLSIHFIAENENGISLFRQSAPIIFEQDEAEELESEGMALARIVSSRCNASLNILNRGSTNLATYLNIQKHFVSWISTWSAQMGKHGCHPAAAQTKDPRISKAIEILERSWYLASIPYDDLEPACGISRVQIDRIFKHELGMSPKRFVEQRCLNKAIELLSASAMSVKEICYALQFRYPSFFCRWFKGLTGYYPAKYRNIVCK
jgi:AraC-like DNA-binding protein